MASPSVSEHRSALRAELESWLCDELGVTAVARICPRCGSSGHGRPVVLGAPSAAGGPPWVSLGYAEGLGVAAWSMDGPVGIDVEPVGPPVGEFGDRLAWTRIEAILKASGAGVSELPHELPDSWTQRLELPPGWLGTVAVAGALQGDQQPVIRWRAVGPAARGS